jgi:hypothetical protein
MNLSTLRNNLTRVWNAAEQYAFAPAGHPLAIEDTQLEALWARKRVEERIWEALQTEVKKVAYYKRNYEALLAERGKR